jgi:hypothetical protein
MSAGASAQSAPIRWKAVPLEQALLEFSEAANVDLVFAHRLVEGRRVSGVWNPGEDPAVTLADLLEGTRLRAERIRARQFVIIAEPLNVVIEPDDPAAYSGTLTGRVVDAETGFPLPGAHALLVDLDIGGVADADGWFSIPSIPTGEYTVQLSYVGYRPVRITVAVYPESSLLPPTIRLRPEPFTLAGATVRPSTDPAPGAGATDLGAGRVPGRQAGALPSDPGGGDLLLALDWLPGVTRSPGAGAAIAVRGMDPSLLRTYRDGAPILEPSHAAGLAGPFQPEALRAVRLHRGTPPAEIGGGLAGALEVEPQDGRGDHPAGLVAVGPLAVRGLVAVPLGARGGFSAAGRLATLGRPVRPWPASPVVHRRLDSVVLDPLGGPLRAGEDGSEVDYGFDDVEATLSMAFTPRQRLSVGGWTAGDRVDADDASAPRGRWRSSVASIRHRALVGETFVVGALYASRYMADERVSIATGGFRDYRADLVEAGLSVEGDQYISLAHTIRAGAAVARRRLEARLERSELSRGLEDASTEAAAWVQDAWRPSDEWQVEIGARGELMGPHRRISPRVLARWSAVAGRVHLRAGAGRQTQAVLRLPDPGPAVPAAASARWLLAGRDTPPAEAWQAGVGVEWAPLLGLALSADAYARRTHALPEPRIDSGDPGDAITPAEVASRYARVPGRAAGVEVAARAEGGAWVIGVTYGLARAETRFPPLDSLEGAGTWLRSRHDRPHSLGVLVQYEGPGWHASARLDALSRTPGDDVSKPARLELAAGYRLFAAGARWDLAVRVQPTAARSTPPVTQRLSEDSIVPDRLAFAADGATLPAWPVFSVRAAW